MVMGSKMKHYIKILIILFICISRSNGSQIWKITTNYGSNLSSTELIEISNDSLHTEMLGSRKSYAVKDIARITYFKSNVNFAMIVGAGTGGILGLYLNKLGNKDNSIKKDGITSPLLGIISGTIFAHLLSSGESIDLKKQTLLEKEVTLNLLISNSN